MQALVRRHTASVIPAPNPKPERRSFAPFDSLRNSVAEGSRITVTTEIDCRITVRITFIELSVNVTAEELNAHASHLTVSPEKRPPPVPRHGARDGADSGIG